MRMSSESKAFFKLSFPLALVGVLVSRLLDLGETATFAVTMGPVFVVMAIMIYREPVESASSDRRVHPPSHRGA